MSWNALTLPGGLLSGIDSSAFGHLQESTLDGAGDTDEDKRFLSARNKLRLRLQSPKLLGGFAAEYGLGSFFDDLAANADLLGDVQTALSYCYAWFRYTHDNQSPGDIDDVRAERMEELLMEVLMGLSQSVPVTLGISSKPEGRPQVSGFGIAMDMSGRDNFLDSDANA